MNNAFMIHDEKRCENKVVVSGRLALQQACSSIAILFVWYLRSKFVLLVACCRSFRYSPITQSQWNPLAYIAQYFNFKNKAFINLPFLTCYYVSKEEGGRHE